MYYNPNYPTIKLLLFFVLIVTCSSIYAEVQSPLASEQIQTPAQTKPAYIALIIDDLGYRPNNDKRAILLDGRIAYAFLPGTPHAEKLANLAHKNKKEVILHLPMQAEQSAAQETGVLTVNMDKKEFIQLVEKSMSLIPFISGINNHMGSLLTQSEKHMHWLMSFLSTRNTTGTLTNDSSDEFFFIDSRTTNKTTAEKVAQMYQLPNTRRNVFLDHVHTKEAIEKQYQRLIKLAKKHGSALAIGHPFKLTLSFLEEKLPELNKNGIKLVSVKELINIQRDCFTQPCKIPLIAKKNIE
jgi:uncharacterized protein